MEAWPIGIGRVHRAAELVQVRTPGRNCDRPGWRRHAAQRSLWTAKDFDLADVIHALERQSVFDMRFVEVNDYGCGRLGCGRGADAPQRSHGALRAAVLD